MTVRQTLSLVLGLLMAMGPLPAQDAAPPMTIEDLRMVVSRSLVIDYPADISRISTSNPEVVDAVPATTREFLLHGKGIGNATVVVWAKNGQRTMYNVLVDHNLDPIRKLLKETFPNEPIQVQAGRDSVTLTGLVSSKDVSDRAVAMLAPLAKSIVSDLRVSAPVSKQIVLKVRFAELNRSYAHQFGATFLSTGFLNTPGQLTTQQFSGGTPSVLSGTIPGGLQGTSSRWNLTDALNVFAFRPDLNLTAIVKLLASQGILQILAEPNVVTSNGQAASFLVGGEFPVPVLQGGANAGAVTVQFREFGIRLSFNPLLTQHGTIKLYVKPEVSTIDLANSVTVSGFVIPALATKRIETNIELGPGQSFVIGGLLDDRVNETMARLPGLSNIPVLGSLFRSRSEQRAKTELIIMVTPEIVLPLDANDPKPSPVWPKPFLEKLEPGDKIEGVFKSGTVPTVAEAEHKQPKAPVDPAKASGKDDGGPLAKLKFWGRDKDGRDKDSRDKDGKDTKDPKAKQTAQGMPAITPVFQQPGVGAPPVTPDPAAVAPAPPASPDPVPASPSSPPSPSANAAPIAPDAAIAPAPAVVPDPAPAAADVKDANSSVANPVAASPVVETDSASAAAPANPAPANPAPVVPADAPAIPTPGAPLVPDAVGKAPAGQPTANPPAANPPAANPPAANPPAGAGPIASLRRPMAASLTSLPVNAGVERASDKPAEKGGN